jgi:hypothetical protein
MNTTRQRSWNSFAEFCAIIAVLICQPLRAGTTSDDRAADDVWTGRKRFEDGMVEVITRRDGSWRIGWGQNTRFTERPPAK